MSQQGFYTDPPGRRLAYDIDGTVAYLIDSSNTITIQNQAFLQALNNESNDAALTINQGGYYAVGLMFPDKRDLTDIYHYATNDGGGAGNNVWGSVYVSSNTTNGADGNWTNVGTISSVSGPQLIPGFRMNWTGFIHTEVKSVKFDGYTAGAGGQINIKAYHLYGRASSVANPHRLIFCDSSGTDLVRDMDYGDIARNTTEIWSPSKTFNEPSALYLKNISTERTAVTVQIGTNSLTFSEMENNVSISNNNIAYGQTINYTNIAPGQIVGPIYVKYVSTPTTTLGLQTMRLKVTVSSWV